MKSEAFFIPCGRVPRTIRYLLRKIVLAVIVLSNCGTSIDAVLKALRYLVLLRAATNKPGMHIVFSPAKSDQIDGKKEQKIAKFIYAALKLPEGWPFLLVKHQLRKGKKEPHYHVFVPVVNDRGERLPNPPTGYSLIQLCAAIEIKFNLTKTPGLDNTQPDNMRFHFRLLQRLDADKLTDRDLRRFVIFFTVYEAIEANVSGSLDDFVELVMNNGIEVNLVKRKLAKTAVENICGIIFKYGVVTVAGRSLCKNYSLPNLLVKLESKKHDYASTRTPEAFLPTAAEAVAGDNGTIIPKINPADSRPGCRFKT